MSLYTIALFIHLAGVVLIFAGFGTWLIGMVGLWRAQGVEQVRAITWLMLISSPVVIAGVVVLAAGGIYMAVVRQGFESAWMRVASLSFILLAPLGAFLIEPRVRVIAQAAANVPDGPLSTALRARVHDPVVATALQIYAACLLAIIFLMTNKPSLVTSLGAMGAAFVIGLAASTPLWWMARTWRVAPGPVRTPARKQ
jgi:hypothetical protein